MDRSRRVEFRDRPITAKPGSRPHHLLPHHWLSAPTARFMESVILLPAAAAIFSLFSRTIRVSDGILRKWLPVIRADLLPSIRTVLRSFLCKAASFVRTIRER